MDCVSSDKQMQNQEMEGAVKGQRDMEAIRYGGNGPQWPVMPMKKKEIEPKCETEQKHSSNYGPRKYNKFI